MTSDSFSLLYLCLRFLILLSFLFAIRVIYSPFLWQICMPAYQRHSLHFLICCSKSDVDWEIQWSQLLKLGLKLRKIFVTLTTSAPDSSAFFLVVSSLLAIEKKNNQVSVLWICGDKSHTGDNHAELMGRFMHWKQSARCYCQEILRIFIIFLP